jgi:hypothetical protein
VRLRSKRVPQALKIIGVRDSEELVTVRQLPSQHATISVEIESEPMTRVQAENLIAALRAAVATAKEWDR